MNGLALCAGIGGLELGLGLAIPEYRTICMVEGETYGAAILATRMEQGYLDPCPVWDDLRTFDCDPWRGKVHIISAGFPCQPWSVAGKRKGTDDERWLWPDIARIIRKVGPELVFLENVPGLLVQGLGHVLGDLAEIGYDAEWGVFSAAQCGSSHQRKRLFTLAYPQSIRWRNAGEPRKNRNVEKGGNAISEQEHKYIGNDPRVGRLCGRVAIRKKEHSDEIPIWPPGPSSTDEWSKVLTSDPSLEPAICRVADGVPDWVEQCNKNRTNRLRALGNAVVPITAALAFRTLYERITT